jgi:hypothetical protein
MLSTREIMSGAELLSCCCTIDHERSVSFSHSVLIMRMRRAAVILGD